MPVTRTQGSDRYAGRTTTLPVDLSLFDTDDLAQGSTNLYASAASIRGFLQAIPPINYDSVNGVFSLVNPTYLQSVVITVSLAHAGVLGFYGTTPASQPSDVGAASTLTDSSGGSADATVAAVSGTGDDATLNDNFADIVAAINDVVGKVNALRSQQQTLGLMA